jgi:hypothetical protein
LLYRDKKVVRHAVRFRAPLQRRAPKIVSQFRISFF